jgi:ribosomal protein S18 acetylase RimI-like enzyme
VGEREDKLVAVAMGGYEGHRGWVNYLAVEDDLRGMGYARQMMDELEVRLLTKGCPKINLQVRGSNLDVQRFYEALGYKKDACISMGKRLISD